MPIELLTKEDLEQFKVELFKKLEIYFNNSPKSEKPFLKSKDVMEILGVSSGTLQTFRINKVLNPKKLLGTLYYDRQEVYNLLHSSKK